MSPASAIHILPAYKKHQYKKLQIVYAATKQQFPYFDVLLTVHLSVFIAVINQIDAQNFCFTISLFHAYTCFEHMCSSSGG